MPIVDIEGLGKIQFPDSMSPADIDRAIQKEILPMVAMRVPSAMVGGLSPDIATGGNPFTKGTVKADANWKVGDRFRYRVIDMLTKEISPDTRGGMVKQVTDTEVIYGNGRVTDLLGNTHVDHRGRTFIGNQIFISEYRIGRKWTTVFRGTRGDDEEDEWTMDMKVVARQSVTVPAGTFDAFKVEGNGFMRDKGNRIELAYWVAPDKVRSFIAYETIVHRSGRRRRFGNTNRLELVAYQQK